MLDVDEARQLIIKGNQLYDDFLSINMYQFKENSLEYFFIKQGTITFNTDIDAIKIYHQIVMKGLEELITHLSKINDKSGIGEKVRNRMQITYDMIVKIKVEKPLLGKFNVQKYMNDVLKKIVKSYTDYISYLQVHIEHKNVVAVEVVELLNEYLNKLHIYSMTCYEGDEWDELIFDPEINISDNITDDEDKEDCIHKVYQYAYAICISDEKNPFILNKGKVSLWKLRR